MSSRPAPSPPLARQAPTARDPRVGSAVDPSGRNLTHHRFFNKISFLTAPTGPPARSATGGLDRAPGGANNPGPTSRRSSFPIAEERGSQHLAETAHGNRTKSELLGSIPNKAKPRWPHAEQCCRPMQNIGRAARPALTQYERRVKKATVQYFVAVSCRKRSPNNRPAPLHRRIHIQKINETIY